MANGTGDDRLGGVDTDISLEQLPLHSTTLLTVLDARGVIQYESPSIDRLYGFDQEALIGQQVADYVHPEDRNRVMDAFRAVVSGTEQATESVEYRHRQADGTYRWVESVASTNPTPEGYYVANTRDISTQKERTRELERKNDRLAEFADTVAHDLRNPLTVAMGALDLAREECESDQFDDIAWAHDRMATLIDDLLVLAQSGEQIDDVEAVTLDGVVEDCWNAVVTDDATLSAETSRVLDADRLRLQQLLENLFRNAIEHGTVDREGVPTPGKNAGVTITVGDLDDGFYVADDGLGIPTGKRETVFASGYSTAVGNTGIGLRIVEQIAHAHDWELTLTSGDDGGARFEFTGVTFPEPVRED